MYHEPSDFIDLDRSNHCYFLPVFCFAADVMLDTANEKKLIQVSAGMKIALALSS